MSEIAEFGTPVHCLLHNERACVCEVTPCPCDCHTVDAPGVGDYGSRVHPFGCVCETCSAAYERDVWDPRMGAR